jgi:hypothetical protein
MIQMIKVSIEVRNGTARFMVGVKVEAQSIQQAQSIVQARYPGSVARVKFPTDPAEGFFLEERAA